MICETHRFMSLAVTTLVPWNLQNEESFKSSKIKFSQKVVHIRHLTYYDQQPIDYCYQTDVYETTSISSTQDLSSSSISVLFCFPLLGQSWNIHSFKIKRALRLWDELPILVQIASEWLKFTLQAFSKYSSCKQRNINISIVFSSTDWVPKMKIFYPVIYD